MEHIDIVTLLVQLASGALGGNIAGALFRNVSLGVVGNSLAGIIGGGVGGHLLTTMFNLPAAAGADAIDPTALLGQVASGGGGGIAVVIVLGILKCIFR